MSTGLNCEFIETEPGKWYYLLEHGSAPKQSWDWREFSDAYGPFADYETAHRHLSDNHANPGGHSVLKYKTDRKIDDVLKRLIAEAQSPSRERSFDSLWRRGFGRGL